MYLKYPTKVLALSQNYSDNYSHKISSTGKPASYPIDETCGDTGRDYFYAPCDLTIKRIYGVGNSGTNTIWFQSKSKVKLANGTESYVTIMVIHPNDDDLKKLKKGQLFKQGDKIMREGKDGNATGYHFHIECAACEFSKLKNSGWVKNSKSAWVISNNAIKPEDAFFIDPDFTKIKQAKGLKFKTLPKPEPAPTPEPAPAPQPTPTPQPSPTPKADILTLVKKTIRGDFGNGQARKKALGANYNEVQRQVNLNIKHKTTKWNNIKLY